MAREKSAFVKAMLSAACLVASLGLAASAVAGPETLREGLFGTRPSEGRTPNAPAVARYVSEDGLGFTLERSRKRALLKFDNSQEVWALSPHPAPRGDIIYKNDLGRPMLRATRLGGLTLFTEARPSGAAASLSGAGAPLRLTPLGPQQLAERLLQASARASRSARRLIQFEAEAAPESSALIADAAIVTAEAVARMSRRPNGNPALAQVTKVTLVQGKKVNVVVQQRTMLITVSPDDGYAGRPSSARIMAAGMK
jgi:hypothetical protein